MLSIVRFDNLNILIQIVDKLNLELKKFFKLLLNSYLFFTFISYFH